MTLLGLLYEALATPHGKIVLCESPFSIRQQLIQLRKAEGNDALSALRILIPPFADGEVWLVKRTGQGNAESQSD